VCYKYYSSPILPYQCATNIIVALYYLTSVFQMQQAGDFSIKYRCDLANNNGEGQGGSTMSVRNSDVYVVSCNIHVFHSLLYLYVYIGFKTSFYVVQHLDSIASYLPTGLHLHHSNILYENISIFFICPSSTQ